MPSPYDVPTLKSKLNEALNTIDAAPEKVRQRESVVALRAALEDTLEDIETNPGEFVGGGG